MTAGPRFTTNEAGEPLCIDCGELAWECRCAIVRGGVEEEPEGEDTSDGPDD